jgi:hypothetical protein
MAYSFEQFIERSCDVRSSEGFWNQQNFLGIPGTEARVSLFGSVTDDDDGKFGVILVFANGVEERLAHIENRTIEHERIGALLHKQIVDVSGVPGGENVVAAIAQCKRQQFGDFRRVVDKQDAPQPYYFLPVSAKGSRFFLPAEGSRSRTHTRPPAV